jgi:hypothetical protein
MQPIFSLPPWGDLSERSSKFRVWFNQNARQRFNDHKWRSLIRTFEKFNGDVALAVQHVPDCLDSETWEALCHQYAANVLPDDSGKV